MGQSVVKNFVHIVFSTKHRQPLIRPPYEQELYTYLGGVCNALECQSIKVGGHIDHIHVLCMLSKKLALVKLIEEIKSHSSKWMKTQHESLQHFYWQSGYGAFSVNPAELDAVISYIEQQAAHHTSRIFQEECRLFLKKYKVDYDERYVWD